MVIGIHKNNSAYSDRWIEYCKENKIDFKIVNAYSDSIISDLQECDLFLWHHWHNNYKDVNFAKQLLYSLEQAGKKVFPDFATGWHFDDKLGQKYLFEAHNIKMAPGFAFYDKESALEWANCDHYPKVFKLRGGAGSSNVKLVTSRKQAVKLIKKAFGNGFSAFDYFSIAKDKFKLALKGRASLYDVFKYVILGFYPKYNNSHLLPRQKGYIYFQEFIPNDGYDIRVEITGDKALAMVRYSRDGDFRASGSNNLVHDTDLINKDVIDFAFNIADTLHLQSCALDLVKDRNTGELYLIENSYCYGVDSDEFDYGYWTRDGLYHKDVSFNGLDWIIELFLDKNS